MAAAEKNLEERVNKLEIIMDLVVKGIEEIKLEIREGRRETQQEIRVLNTRMDTWLRWILGFIFSSWLTTMLSIWLKK